MAAFLGFVGMIVVGALLIFIASNKKGHYLLWKMQFSNLFSKTAEPSDADAAVSMLMPLIMGVFLLVTGLVLFIVYLLG